MATNVDAVQKVERAIALAERVAAGKVQPARLRKLDPDSALMVFLHIAHNERLDRLTDAAIAALVERASESERVPYG